MKRFHEVLLQQRTNLYARRKWMLAAIADSTTIRFIKFTMNFNYCEITDYMDLWAGSNSKNLVPGPGLKTLAYCLETGSSIWGWTPITLDKFVGLFVGYQVEEVIFRHPRNATTVYQVRSDSDQPAVIKQTTRVSHEVKILQILENNRVPYVPRCIFSTNSYLIITPVGSTSLHKYRIQQKIAAPKLNEIFKEVSMALSSAHKANILHRDIKPGNIILVNEQNVSKAYLIDWYDLQPYLFESEVAQLCLGGTALSMGNPSIRSVRQPTLLLLELQLRLLETFTITTVPHVTIGSHSSLLIAGLQSADFLGQGTP